MANHPGVHTMRNPTVEIDEEVFANQLTKARFVPDTPVSTLRTFGGVYQDIGTTAWTLELAGAQAYDADGLAKYLNTNAGTKKEVVLQAKPGAGGDIATATVTLMPVEWGGEEGAWRTFDVTLLVDDEPVFTTAV